MESDFYNTKKTEIPLNIRIRVLRDQAFVCADCKNDVREDEERKFKKIKPKQQLKLGNIKVVCAKCASGKSKEESLSSRIAKLPPDRPERVHKIREPKSLEEKNLSIKSKKKPSWLRPTMPKSRPVDEAPFCWTYFKVVGQNHGRLCTMNGMTYQTQNVPWQDLWKAYHRCPSDFVEASWT